MDIQTLIMPIVVIAFGLFAGATFVYRKMTAGEAFKLEKFLPTMGIGGIAAFALYLASGTFPSIDTLLTQIELMAPGGVPSITVILAALLAIYNSLVKSAAATPITTPAKQAATVEQAKSGLEKTTEGALPDAKVNVLGIYGDSAAAHVPGPSFTCDVNQVPQLFADLKVLATGNGFYSIFIDGTPLKDNAMQNFRATVAGAILPISFWIPQKFRTTDQDHIITITTGAETTADFGLSNDKEEIPITFTSQNFGLKFTGTKPLE
ncbi:MAG: hypothetical protein Q8R70_04930 [Methanoregula sp.]|nr:hypothetical protein [Methanoregula sp.]